MEKHDSSLPEHPLRPTTEPDPYLSSAVRVAGTYFIAGLLWIALSDLTLAGLGALSASGFLLSLGKGSVFVLLSAGLVFGLCQREYRNTSRAVALLRTVVEGTTDAVFVKDRQGRYQLVNAAAARFLGRSVAEVLGRNDRELFESPAAGQLMEVDQAVMAGGTDVTVEETLTSAGVTRTYQTTKGPYFDASGEVAGLIGISRNVTDRVLIESALRESDARLREAQRIARLGSWSWEPPTNRVWWSDAEFELLGADPQVVRPSFEAFLQFLHPDDRTIAIARVEAMRAGANEFASDLRVVLADGPWMWIHSQARATRDSAGNLIRVEGTDQDITAQRLAQQSALESERRLQAAVEVAGLGIILIDYDQLTADLSAIAAEQFGLPAGKVARSEMHSRFHPADGVDISHLLADALDPAGSGWFAAEHRVVRPDGTMRWLNVRKQVSFMDGRPHAAVVVTADVTERRNAEARIREQEMLVREASELAKVGGWGFDPVTLDADWTPEVARMFGLGPVGPASLAAALEYINPEHAPAVEAAIEAARKDAIPYDMELELHAADGQTRWVRTICRPIVEGGRVTRVRGSLQDITDRKRAEADLRASEERYRLLFESNPHPMWLYDVESLRFLAVNDAALLTYGYTRDEFLAMTLRDIRPEADVPKLESAVARTTRGLSLASEWKHKRKNGTMFDVDVSSHDLPEEYGRTRLVLALDVTERKRAEAERQASERRLRLALESAGAVAFMWHVPSDSITRYYSTEPALPVTAPGAGTLDGVRARIHPDDLPGFDARLARCLAEGTDYHNQYRVVRPDGMVASLEDYGFLDRSPDGSPLSLTGMALDVTDRVAATEALRTSEARYRQLVDLLPTAIFVHSDNVIHYCNPALLKLMGADHPDDLIGRSPYDILHPSCHETLRRRQAELAQAQAVLPGCEMLGLRCDGRTVPVYTIAAPVDGYGKPAILVALSDLTERERAAALLRSVLDSVGDAIVTIDTQGIVTSSNRATERLFGYTDTELLGRNVCVLMPEPHRGQHDRYVADYLRTNVPKVIGVGREVEGCRKDGSTFPAELTITEFLRNGEREFTGVLRDITARRQLEEQFRQAQKMEAVGRLAGGVAHDFNNLLTVINGYSELVLANLPVDDAARWPLAAIHDAGDRAARLTQQLLALSRKSMAEPRLLDLNELVAESAKLFRRLIGEDVTLAVLADPLPVRVMLDPGQLEQVLMNLVVNARDAMPTGGQLTLETRNVDYDPGADMSHPNLPAGRYASLRVTDTGCGINAEVRDKIFEPFFTTKGVGKGTGLGLAVVHGVVQQSGGSVAVESTVGVGTTFKISLPAAREAVGKVASAETHVAPRGDETVLVVEDEEAVRTLVRVALEGRGYTVLTASDGHDALNLLQSRSEAVDLLITDVIMPGISGRELALGARTTRPDLRVLYMSGYTDDALDRHGLHGTGDQFIQKPFTPLSLARRVRAILDQSE